MNSLYIFHRDLNIEDNICLYRCIKSSNKITLLFMFDCDQINSKKNEYFSPSAFLFILESLKDLSSRVDRKLHYYNKKEGDLGKYLSESKNITDVWEHKDFSPFAQRRENLHKKICSKRKIAYHLIDTITLSPMGTYLKKDKTAYVKYTPFYSNAKSIKICGSPKKINKNDIKKLSTPPSGNDKILDKLISEYLTEKSISPSRKKAVSLLSSMKKKISGYSSNRDHMFLDASSHLSPYIQHGILSPREVYRAAKECKKSEEFIKQIYWREFYIYITYYVSRSYRKISWTIPKYNKIKWDTSNAAKKELKKWKNAQTEVPIVDAGMSELLMTGFMHNRARMICAMYLIHYLGIHWKEGEKWFAQNLTDYSYHNNYGGWVWCASTEIYSNPYFRIFSLKQQNIRYDKNCDYIKKWCPQYRELSAKEIHDIYDDDKLLMIRKKRIKYLKGL